MIITWTETDTTLTATVSGSITAADFSYPSASTAIYIRMDSSSVMSTTADYSTYDFDTSAVSAVLVNDCINPWNFYNYSDTNTNTGDTFGFNYRPDLSLMRILLPTGYVAGTELSGSLTINEAGTNLLTDLPLSQMHFGDIITMDGAPLVTYVNGMVIPEPGSSLLVALSGLAGCVRRRRRA